MPQPPPSPIRIGSATHPAPLSPQQQQFDTLVQRIAAQRELLAAWDEAVGAYRERYAREFEPLLATYRALSTQLAQWLDTAADRKGLSRADRATLGEIVAGLAGDLADSAPDEAARAAMQALRDRHAGGGDAERADGPAMAQETPGLDPDSPEEVLRRVEEQMHAAQARAEQARQAHHAARRRRKPPSARERQEREQARQASQSLRDVYRKLASALHPDRETDPAERTRKTALMQRVNQAYAAGRLLDLLQLQLEAEQIDPAHIAHLGEERLSHYNRVLADQLAGLQREVQAAQHAFCAEFGLDPSSQYKPAKLMSRLRTQLQHLQQDAHHLRLLLRALEEDPDELKRWLRHERAAMRAADAFPDDPPDRMGR
ncbi:molecular chaperone DnaJ [Alicycliphilus denitrificans]|uniref:molecular chaperone DnaJ n=1 Tax=Alicycliphilus denitrificans TaxID=179636 RepID=UPI003A7FAF67